MPTARTAAPANVPVARPVPSPAAPVVPSEPAESARAVGLRYVSDADPGLRRESSGGAFRYRDADGAVVTDPDVLARIRSLAIPPSWTSVWICANPRGHLQATGRDARGRKQYRYHPRWHAVRGDGKFSRLVAFGQQLPRLRRRLRRDLGRRGLPGEKVLAVAVSLLAGTLVRVGNEEYARTNRSYGLTTLRARHVAFLRKGRALLRFRGKSGQPHEVQVDDARLTRVLRRCTQLPGQSLFQYLDDDGTRQTIDSGMVNQYLHDAMGEDFTAKDFRTWGGTVQAIACLARTPLPEEASERELAATITGVVREVASTLRNTPAVCRGSYIHPDVFDAWRDGSLHRLVPPARAAHPRQLELATLRLLRRVQRRRARPAGRRSGKAKP